VRAKNKRPQMMRAFFVSECFAAALM